MKKWPFLKLAGVQKTKSYICINFGKNIELITFMNIHGMNKVWFEFSTITAPILKRYGISEILFEKHFSSFYNTKKSKMSDDKKRTIRTQILNFRYK